jgi:hypothetical protein
LLGTIVEEGRRFASAADLKVSDMSAQSPVGTTLAILERTLKVMSAVQARIHYSMKQEFKLLKTIIRDYTPEDYSYEPVEGPPRAKKSDYDQVYVIPVSDPNAATMSQKVVQYQAVMQLAQGAPQLYDLPYLHRQMLEVLGVKNAAKLVPNKEDMKPRDPVTENMDIINGKPAKAFDYQDHAAHIAVHMAAVQDPKIAKMIGQSPMANQIMGAMAAHLQEHVAFEYRKQLEEQLGVPYPHLNDPDDTIPPEMEVELSRLAAAGAQKLLAKGQAEAAQQQAQQVAQDPVVQMQMQELQLKAQDLALKDKKLQIEAADKADRLELEEKRIEAQKEIAGMQVGAKSAKDRSELEAKMELEGIRLGSQIAEKRSQLNKPPKKGSE